MSGLCCGPAGSDRCFSSPGAAHGLSAIIQMLLGHMELLRSEPSVEGELRTCVDYMLSIMQPNGNIAPELSEALANVRRDDSAELVHWCHGGPGR